MTALGVRRKELLAPFLPICLPERAVSLFSSFVRAKTKLVPFSQQRLVLYGGLQCDSRIGV
jgi:hypothetical protein